jgi:hypothetical protein
MKIPMDESQFPLFWEILVKISNFIEVFTPEHHSTWPFFNSLDGEPKNSMSNILRTSVMVGHLDGEPKNSMSNILRTSVMVGRQYTRRARRI